MRSILFSAFILLAFISITGGQEVARTAPPNFEAERQLAKLAVEAHGGDKLRNMKTLVVIGSVDASASNLPQPIPATFVTIFAGDKYRVEIKNPFQPLKQVFDGTTTVSSLGNNFSLPPFNRMGLPLLQRVGETGFIVTSIPDGKKGEKGFRVTSPEGYFTDFYLDDKTNQIKAYDSTYNVNGRTVKSAVEVDRMKLVDGVTIPDKYVQRIDLEQLTVYLAFTAKQIQVNSEVAADVFTSVN
jgi:hypothetical protein